jgi:hypothetical protein
MNVDGVTCDTGDASGPDFGCDGICFSGTENDECGVCGGDGAVYNCSTDGSGENICGLDLICESQLESACFPQETIACYLDEDGDGRWTEYLPYTACPPALGFAPDCADFNPGYGVGFWFNSSEIGAEEQFGCMDQAACNFDANNSEDDGIPYHPTNNPDGCSYEVTCCQDILPPDGNNYCDDPLVVESYCPEEEGIEEGTCPDGWISSGLGLDVYGCTDSEACNDNSEATIDDGSCTYPLGETKCWHSAGGWPGYVQKHTFDLGCIHSGLNGRPGICEDYCEGGDGCGSSCGGIQDIYPNWPCIPPQLEPQPSPPSQ